MKTIFVTSFHPLISRNILGTPFVDRVLGVGDVELVVFVPPHKKDFFETRYKHPGVTYTAVPLTLTRRELWLRSLALAAVDTATLRIKRKTELKGSGAWLTHVMRPQGLAYGVIRRLSRHWTPRERFAPFFKDGRPALVFAADVQNENDVRLLHEAKDRGIPTVGMVRSWDNLTAKGLLRVLPDRLVVHNEIIKDEAMRHHGVPEKIIDVVGIPHYDGYVTEARASRETFCSRAGLDPAKRFVLYAPVGERYLGESHVERDVLALLDAELPPEYQILVRLPLADTIGLAGYTPSRRVRFDRPGWQPNDRTFRDTELRPDDDRHLADTLFLSDVVVIGPSTMSIDAALFDKPVILIGFDGASEQPYYQSIRRYYDYDHQRVILESGGARLVKNAAELREWLKRYRANPTLDAQGRARIVRDECGCPDGKASERLAEVIRAALPL